MFFKKSVLGRFIKEACALKPVVVNNHIDESNYS